MSKSGILVLIFLTPFLLFAQNENSSGVKVQVFDGNSSSPKEEIQSKDRMGDMNLVTFNTYMLGRGIFSMGYERVLHPKHSVNFNAGFTYRDYIFEAFQQSTFDLISGNKNTPKIGYMLDVNYKFWPKFYDEFEGVYLSPGFSYKTYSRDVVVSESSLNYNSGVNSADLNQTVSYNMTEASIKFGYMYESWWIDDMIIDFYVGFGIRNANINYFEIEETPYDYNSPTIPQNKIVSLTKNVSMPCVYLGAKMGIPF